jgi:hypothetical protein
MSTSARARSRNLAPRDEWSACAIFAGYVSDGRRKSVTYEEAQVWFKENGGTRLSSRGVTTVTVLGRSVRFSAKLPEETEFPKAVARLKRILA